MKTIAVWFSCGAASAVAAKVTLEKYGDTHNVRVINNPVIEEHSDNQRFLRDVERWLGVKVEGAVNPDYPSCSAVDVWEKRQYMSGIAGAPCTLELKKKARREWEENNDADFHVLGFTADEARRAANMQAGELPELLPILVNEGITKADCFMIIRDAGIELPEIYKLGYPNANCIGCVKATSPTYWNHVRKMHPEIFQERADQSRRLGVRLVRVKGERIFLDELHPESKGQAMKNMDFECGIFCGENE